MWPNLVRKTKAGLGGPSTTDQPPLADIQEPTALAAAPASPGQSYIDAPADQAGSPAGPGPGTEPDSAVQPGAQDSVVEQHSQDATSSHADLGLSGQQAGLGQAGLGQGGGLRRCGNVECTAVEHGDTRFKTCSRCRAEFYCSVEVLLFIYRYL